MSIIKLSLPMPKIQVSDKWNKTGAPLLVLAIQGGSLIKGKHECIYAAVPLTPKKMKFLRKLVKLSHAIGVEGTCGQPAVIEVRDWSLIWDQEPEMKVDATYFHVEGDTIWAEGYDSKGRRLGSTVTIELQEFKRLSDVPVIWHDSDESNALVKAKFGRSFAKESSNRLRRFGIDIPSTPKIKVSSEMRSMLLDLEASTT
jgi:hypothetical protein